MLSIYAPAALIPVVKAYIAEEPRLDELIEIYDFLSVRPASSAMHFIIRPKQGIMHPVDWQSALPPYLLPEEIPFNRENLLGLIFAKLGNEEKMATWLTGNKTLLRELNLISSLQQGAPADPADLVSNAHPFEEYRFCHNSAILHHYAATEHSFDPNKTHYFYQEALNCAPNGEHAAFTAKHFAGFLLDMGETDQAEQVLQQALPYALSDDALIELKATLCQVWMKKLVVPYDQALLENLKNSLWEVLQYYQLQQRGEEEALTLIHAAQIAHYSESFAESLGYINRAIQVFQEKEIPELCAQAHYRRALLLYTWAKKGSPQFFKGALDSFKEAVAVFTREDAPEVFAEIQQYLGIIYAEMPDEALKRSMWAAISSSSFQEALAFYTKDRHPYEYAMVCNHFGNALAKYPASVHTDNFEKALFYYNEALEIRTAAAFPIERAATLLNYVEACWNLNLEGKGAVSDKALFENMLAKVQEALALNSDPQVKDEANQQLERLENLRQTLTAEFGYYA